MQRFDAVPKWRTFSTFPHFCEGIHRISSSKVIISYFVEGCWWVEPVAVVEYGTLGQDLGCWLVELGPQRWLMVPLRWPACVPGQLRARQAPDRVGWFEKLLVVPPSLVLAVAKNGYWVCIADTRSRQWRIRRTAVEVLAVPWCWCGRDSGTKRDVIARLGAVVVVGNS